MAVTVVITGVGLITPLGHEGGQVLRRIQAGESAFAPPRHFSARPFACPVCAEVRDFLVQPYLPEPKMIRLMNRDAQFAVAAAHLALQDARLTVGMDYRPDEIALFGATGLAGLPLAEFAPLLKASAGPSGQLDLRRFGQTGLKSISPLLSFKVLANMPVCFISICANIQGPNAIYTPWEGQGAQAIEAGLRAIQSGDARCAVVGGCDSKTHELALMSLQQQGVFDSWRETHAGTVPGEGAVFLVLEEDKAAQARGARAYAQITACSFAALRQGMNRWETYAELLEQLLQSMPPPAQSPETARRFGAIVASADRDPATGEDERAVLAVNRIAGENHLHPKRYAGNLFAAAAALQVGLGAMLASSLRKSVLSLCFGHGTEQAAWILEPAPF